jgi:hypothetical protein
VQTLRLWSPSAREHDAPGYNPALWCQVTETAQVDQTADSFRQAGRRRGLRLRGTSGKQPARRHHHPVRLLSILCVYVRWYPYDTAEEHYDLMEQTVSGMPLMGLSASIRRGSAPSPCIGILLTYDISQVPGPLKNVEIRLEEGRSWTRGEADTHLGAPAELLDGTLGVTLPAGANRPSWGGCGADGGLSGRTGGHGARRGWAG